MTSLGNNLLGALAEPDLDFLKPYLKMIESERGAVLQEEGSDVNFTYFPCDASIVSFEVLVKEGKAIETNLVGREGAIGGVLSKGRRPAYARVRVIFPGRILKIGIAEIEKAKAKSAAVRELFDRYSDCLVAQLLQSSACNAAHPIEQRTAKWLRFALDHTGAKEVPLTQDQLANVLGVSRTYVSRVISRLKTAGVLGTRRGTLCIRDPDMLRRLCCGCHDAVYQHFEAVLGGVYPGVQTRCDPWAPKLPLHSALYPHGEPDHAKGS